MLMLTINILLLCHVYPTDASNILIIFPVPSFSHYLLADRLAEGLVEEGHQVTVIAPYQKERTHTNHSQLVMENFAERFEGIKVELFELESRWPIQQIRFYYKLGYVTTEYVLRNAAILDLVRRRRGEFDVMITDQFCTEGIVGLAHALDAPLVYFSTLMATSWTNYLVRNPAPLAYVPNIFLDVGGVGMGFALRLHNAFLMYADHVYRHYVALPYHERLLHAAFPAAPPLHQLLYAGDRLMLVNSHVSINDPIPRMPNMIEIGGFQVKRGHLPADLRHLLDAAVDGALFFCMGSNLNTSLIPAMKKRDIVRALGRIKQTVFWKWNGELIDDLPSNIILRKWFPQQAMLAHRNTKAFISHGGLLSTIEAVSIGRPILGIPIYGDQKININLAVSRGYALAVPYKDITEERLFRALGEIVNNDSYTQRAQWYSRLMHDRPRHPLKEAIFWVEHVIRHRGVAHLRSKAMDLAWYEYEMLDVVAFVVGVALASLATLFFACRRFIRRFSRPRTSVHSNGVKKTQ